MLTQKTFFLMKTSLRRHSSPSSEHIFKASSRRLDQDEYVSLSHTTSEDLLVKINIFVLTIHLWDIFNQVKLFLLTSLRDVIKMFLRRTPKAVVHGRICLGHTSEKLMVSVQHLQEWYKFLKFSFFTLLHHLVTAYRSVFRTWSKICNGAFLRKYLTALTC